MVISLWDPLTNLSLKDAASSTERVKKKCKLLTLTKKRILAWLMKLNEWKHLCRQFLLLLRSLCLIVFLFCLHFLRHFKIIRCIVIATSTYFLLKYNWKKENLKNVFWPQCLGDQTSMPVSYICHWWWICYDLP